MRLRKLGISISGDLERLYDLVHLFLLGLCQDDVGCCEVLKGSRVLAHARKRNHMIT